MKERILQLCKRLNKFSLDEIETVSEIDSTKILPFLNEFTSFCADVEAQKTMLIFNFSKHVANKFYQYFRTSLYENQKMELLKHFEKNPKVGQERIYMTAKVYLYLYNDKLYVSDKLLKSKDAIKHTNEERLEIKNIYLRSFRKVLSRSFAHRFHIHLAEEIWKWGKDYNQRYLGIKQILFA